MSYLEKRFCVYVHRDKITKEIKYIGSGDNKGSDSRVYTKKNRNKVHLAVWDSLEFEVIKDNLTKEESIEFENKLLSEHNGELLNIKSRSTLAHPIKFSRMTTLFEIDHDSPSYLKWIVRPANAVQIGDPVGWLDPKKGYWKFTLDRKSYSVHRVVWVLHNKIDLDINLVINHIDGNPNNNNPTNLEAVSQKKNMQHNNRKVPTNSTSGIKGVNFISGKWCAIWRVGGKRFVKKFNHEKLFPLLEISESLKLTLELAIKFKEGLSQ